MRHLVIRSPFVRVLVASPRDAAEDELAVREWDGIVQTCLETAFVGGPATIVLLAHSPMQPLMNLGGVERYEDPDSGRVAWCIEACSADLIQEIAHSWEFDIGWLWLTSMPFAELSRLGDLRFDVGDRFAANSVGRGMQIVRKAADGAELWWANPSPSVPIEVDRIAGAAKAAGWAVTTLPSLGRDLEPPTM